jgi:DNA-binding NtrC family response regulator
MSGQILVVDDEPGIRELLSEILADEGYDVALAEDASTARSYRQHTRPDLVLLDIWMPDTDGITLLKEWAGNGQLTMPVVMMSGHGTIDTAVEATRMGAADFLEKPIALQKLLGTVGRVLKHSATRVQPGMSLAGLGRSPVIQTLKEQLTRIANLQTPVLLLSEPGSGARMCGHFLQPSNSPWVELDDPVKLVESPLDLLQQARDGILYIPELCNLSKLAQKGLAMALERAEKYNVRIICASSEDLTERASKGEFDSRLYYALGALSIRIPSLREHRDDIPDIASFILAQLVEANSLPPRRFTTAALNTLRNADWPGNLLQLDNMVHTLAVTADGEEIDADAVQRALRPLNESTPVSLIEMAIDQPLREARDAFERSYFERLIEKEGGNMSRVAELAGVERTHLYRKFKQLGIRLGKKENL